VPSLAELTTTAPEVRRSTPAWITTVDADSHRNTPAGEDNKESIAHISTRYCKLLTVMTSNTILAISIRETVVA